MKSLQSDLSPYVPVRPVRDEFVELRHASYHLCHWGEVGKPLLLMLHGWMDMGMSFQFLVDALAPDWHVVAPDWRGFGLSQWNAGPYYFPDYLEDLDQLLNHLSPGQPLHLIGHSMGGIIAGIYAGVRPERVASLISIEGFGLAATQPGDAVARLRKWLDELNAPPAFEPHADLQRVSQRLMRTNRRLPPDKAAFLANHIAALSIDGEYRYTADPRHKMANPVLYRLEETKAAWRAITAPVLWVKCDGPWMATMLKEDEAAFADRTACVANLKQATINDAGHMVHHDQPAQLARIVEAFYRDLPT